MPLGDQRNCQETPAVTSHFLCTRPNFQQAHAMFRSHLGRPLGGRAYKLELGEMAKSHRHLPQLFDSTFKYLKKIARSRTRA